MTNQTIDGVPRKLLTSLLAWLERANERIGDGDIAEYVELRALLDADKVNNRQMGLVQFVELRHLKFQQHKTALTGLFRSMPSSPRR
ncbi:hypothetical protein [Pseudomonas paracarnis]|uniref:Uncharacterized protein n=1 Tax=Pseudomonas paracarnis TaxID=2750625 RepID=A0ABU6BU51_9PSED|nr:hypothetical protein [Pseudomonas paracarnis]MBW9244141.1 hypothetical protein [Pseudomonas paracarnis]MEB3783697.1 hypothetical protein [Pseudomonas paracarnis]